MDGSSWGWFVLSCEKNEGGGLDKIGLGMNFYISSDIELRSVRSFIPEAAADGVRVGSI